jgi:glycine hydroxymethyltransferase
MLNPGDKILGFDLSHGGHLTHGSRVNYSGKTFSPHFYGVEKESGIIDMDKVEKQALEIQPKMIICGASAYSRDWDFARFRQIADEVGAVLRTRHCEVPEVVSLWWEKTNPTRWE